MSLDRVNILALGPTWFMCPNEKIEGHETWGCNTIYRDRRVDRVFVSHDIREEVALMEKDFISDVDALGVPVVTSQVSPVFKHNVVYPIV